MQGRYHLSLKGYQVLYQEQTAQQVPKFMARPRNGEWQICVTMRAINFLFAIYSNSSLMVEYLTNPIRSMYELAAYAANFNSEMPIIAEKCNGI